MGFVMAFPYLYAIYLEKVFSQAEELSQRVNVLLHKREGHNLPLQHPYECRVDWAVHKGWRQAPQSSWPTGLPKSVGSGFKWEILPQYVRWRATQGVSCYQSPPHTCTHLHKYTGTCGYAYIQTQNVKKLFKNLINFSPSGICV